MTPQARKAPAVEGTLVRRELPAYTLSEAARYVRLPPATLRSWLRGRPYPKRGGTGFFQPLIRLADTRTGLLSFDNVVEAHVLKALRTEHGVSIRAVRDALTYAEREYRMTRLLLRPELRTEAGDVLLEKYGQLVNLSRSGQLAMRKLLEAYVKRVEWDATSTPRRLYPFVRNEEADAPRLIMIDPEIAFGRPVIEHRGVSTAAIADRIDAGESTEAVALDYDLEPWEVEEAVIYERAA